MATTVNKTKKPSAKKTAASSAVKKTEAADAKTSVTAENTTKNTTAKKTAAKKTTAKKTAAKATAASKTAVKKTASKTAKLLCVDYPKTNDTVYCGHYCFRLGSATPAEWVRISLNDGPWLDCRPANGYWWFDWWNFETGTFVLEAVAYINGKEEKAAKTTFKVAL